MTAPKMPRPPRTARSADEIFAAIERQADFDRIDHEVDAMTDDEVDAALRAAGACDDDPIGEPVLPGVPPAEVSPPASGVHALPLPPSLPARGREVRALPPRRRYAMPIAIGAAAMAAAILLYFLARTPRPGIGEDLVALRDAGVRGMTPEEEAASLREEAADAFQARRLDEALAALDRAKQLDPAGDTAGAIAALRSQVEANRELRRRIRDGSTGSEKGPPR